MRLKGNSIHNTLNVAVSRIQAVDTNTGRQGATIKFCLMIGSTGFADIISVKEV